MQQMGFILRCRVLSGLAVVVLAVAPAASAWADDTPEQRAALKGVRSLKVVVDLDENAERENPTWPDRMQADIELRLRRAGIPLVTSAPARLHISVSTYQVSPDRPGYAHTIQTRLLQWVKLVRNEQISMLTSTWEAGSVGWIPDLSSATLVFFGDSVAAQIDKFITAYLEQNP